MIWILYCSSTACWLNFRSIKKKNPAWYCKYGQGPLLGRAGTLGVTYCFVKRMYSKLSSAYLYLHAWTDENGSHQRIIFICRWQKLKEKIRTDKSVENKMLWNVQSCTTNLYLIFPCRVQKTLRKRRHRLAKGTTLSAYVALCPH